MAIGIINWMYWTSSGRIFQPFPKRVGVSFSVVRLWLSNFGLGKAFYVPYTDEDNFWCFNFLDLHTFKNWYSVRPIELRIFFRKRKYRMLELSLLNLFIYWLFKSICQQSGAWLWLKLEECRIIPHLLPNLNTSNEILLIHITLLCLL